jgi:hypothetical protein
MLGEVEAAGLSGVLVAIDHQLHLLEDCSCDMHPPCELKSQNLEPLLAIHLTISVVHV